VDGDGACQLQSHGLAFGCITTPDTGLMLAWVLALGEAALALGGDERRWLTAGAATDLDSYQIYDAAHGAGFMGLDRRDAPRPAAASPHLGLTLGLSLS